MQEICIYIQTVLVKNAKIVQRKYAEICSFICNICRSLYIAYFAFTCTPHFADASLLGHNSQNYDSLGPSELLQLELLCQCTGSWQQPEFKTSSRLSQFSQPATCRLSQNEKLHPKLFFFGSTSQYTGMLIDLGVFFSLTTKRKLELPKT